MLPFDHSTSTWSSSQHLPVQVYWIAEKERAKGKLRFSIITHRLQVLKLSPKMGSLGKSQKNIRQQPTEGHISQQHNLLAGQPRQPAEEGARGKGNSSGTGNAASDLSITGDVRVRGWLHGGVRTMEGKLIGLCPFISDTSPNQSWQASEEKEGLIAKTTKNLSKKPFFFPSACWIAHFQNSLQLSQINTEILHFDVSNKNFEYLKDSMINLT